MITAMSLIRFSSCVCVCAHEMRDCPRLPSSTSQISVWTSWSGGLNYSNFHLRRDSNSSAARTRHCFMRTQRVKKMALNFLFFLPPSHPPLSRNIDLLRAVSEGKSEKIVWNGRRPREKRKISARPPQRRKKSAFFIREASVPYQEWREKTFFFLFFWLFRASFNWQNFIAFSICRRFYGLACFFFHRFSLQQRITLCEYRRALLCADSCTLLGQKREIVKFIILNDSLSLWNFLQTILPPPSLQPRESRRQSQWRKMEIYSICQRVVVLAQCWEEVNRDSTTRAQR